MATAPQLHGFPGGQGAGSRCVRLAMRNGNAARGVGGRGPVLKVLPCREHPGCGLMSPSMLLRCRRRCYCRCGAACSHAHIDDHTVQARPHKPRNSRQYYSAQAVCARAKALLLCDAAMTLLQQQLNRQRPNRSVAAPTPLQAAILQARQVRCTLGN